MLLSVRRRDRALLDRQREEVDTGLDQFQSQLGIEREIVMLRQVVPINRKVIHEVAAQS